MQPSPGNARAPKISGKWEFSPSERDLQGKLADAIDRRRAAYARAKAAKVIAYKEALVCGWRESRQW
jgi:hypothetical protein